MSTFASILPSSARAEVYPSVVTRAKASLCVQLLYILYVYINESSSDLSLNMSSSATYLCVTECACVHGWKHTGHLRHASSHTSGCLHMEALRV